MKKALKVVGALAAVFAAVKTTKFFLQTRNGSSVWNYRTEDK